ncbi:MAG: mechanosensitive ion channel family protein, partial [bacterium]
MNETLGAIAKFLNLTIFTLNQSPITVGSVLIFFIALSCVILLANLIGLLLRKKLLPMLKVDEGTIYNLERLTKYTIILVGAIVCFQFVGIDLSGLAVILGLFSVGIGFGLQNITSNFVAGLILLFERPIKVGDRITIG